MADSGSTILVTMDGYYRNGELIDHKAKADEAVAVAREQGVEVLELPPVADRGAGEANVVMRTQKLLARPGQQVGHVLALNGQSQNAPPGCCGCGPAETPPLQLGQSGRVAARVGDEGPTRGPEAEHLAAGSREEVVGGQRPTHAERPESAWRVLPAACAARPSPTAHRRLTVCHRHPASTLSSPSNPGA